MFFRVLKRAIFDILLENNLDAAKILIKVIKIEIKFKFNPLNLL